MTKVSTDLHEVAKNVFSWGKLYVDFLILLVENILHWFWRGIPEFLDSGRKSWALDPGRWTLDAGLWLLDSGRWPLDADFKDGPGTMHSELACFSETKRYFNYSTNQKQGWQFLYYREIPHKETKHNEPFKGVLKNSYSLGQNSPKNNNCDDFL